LKRGKSFATGLVAVFLAVPIIDVLDSVVGTACLLLAIFVDNSLYSIESASVCEVGR